MAPFYMDGSLADNGRIMERLPVVVGEKALEELRSGMSGAGAETLEQVDLALMAWRLKLQGQFDELLCLSRLRGVERLDYQVETILKVLRTFRGRALLADEVGLGKTIEAGSVLLEYILRGLVRRALVLVPAALVPQWRAELSEKFGIEVRATEDSAFRGDGGAAWTGEGVVVASLQTARRQPHAGWIRGQRWDLVIVDEAHHVKRRGTESYRLVDGLKSRFLLLLTATPVETDLEELYNLITLLKPGQLTTPAGFKRQFVARGDPLAPVNRERLRELLAEVMIRNTRATAGLGVRLPPRFARTVIVEPSPEEVALYATVIQVVRSGIPAEGRLLLRLLLEEAGSGPMAARKTIDRLAVSGRLPADSVATLKDAVDSACRAPSRKMVKLVEILRAAGGKAVVFTKYRGTLDAITGTLDEAGIRHTVFHGGMGAREKREAVERLRDDVPVLAATEVGGEGHNMQCANVLVNVDLPWNPMRIEQRIGRLHRLGQTREVQIFNLCGRGSAEERILDILDRRIHLFELVVGEVDLILGRAMEEREFEDRILDIYANSKDENGVERGFENLGDELDAARQQYDKVKALDDALFQRDYET